MLSDGCNEITIDLTRIGPPGKTGATPNLTVGTVETLPMGEPAEVTITGTPEDPVLNFELPQADIRAEVEAMKQATADMIELDQAVTESESERNAQEDAREVSEEGRVASENARNSAELTRQQQEAIRVSGEDQRNAAESTRRSNETTRTQQEQTREGDEQQRKQQEDARKASESSRVTAETGRVGAENTRVSQETGRVSAEGARVTAENTRKSAETARGTAETGRATAETGRATAETARKSAETARATAETGRVTAESGRVTAENTRQTQEATRQTDTDAAIQRCDDAVDDLSGTALNVAASKWAFVQEGASIAINPALDSKVKVTPTATTTLTYNGQTMPVTANTPVEITAIAGVNTLSVPTGTLRVEYNRDSMDVLAQLTVPVTATASIAQVSGLVNDLPLGLTARMVAMQAGTGTPSPDNVRAITGKSAVSATRCAVNLFDQFQTPAMKQDCNITNASGWLRLTSTVSGAGTVVYSRYTLPNAYVGQTITVTPTWINSAANIGHALLLWVDPATGNSAGGTTYTMYVSGVSTTITVPPPPTAVPNALLSIVLYANKSGGTVAIGSYTDFKIMMRLGATGGAYEPYYGIAKAVTLPETVYGLMGNPVIADLGQGIATIGTAYKKYAGTEAWQNFVPYNGTSLQYFCFQVVTAGIVSTANASVLCSHLPTVTDVAKATGNTSGIQTSSSSVYVKIPRTLLNVTLPEGYDSQAGFDASGVVTNAWKAYLAGQLAAGKPLEVVYTLGTPHTLAIMPTSIQALAGTNTAYTDGGGDTTITGRQGAQGMADRLAVCEAGLKALTGG